MARRWPIALIGALVAVAIVEAGLARSKLAEDPIGLEWRYRDKAGRRGGPACRILGVGDSLMRYGLAPGVLRERLGVGATNLGLTGAPPAATDLILAHALAGESPPRSVLVDFSPYLMDGSAPGFDHLLPEVATLADAFRNAVADRDASAFANLAAGRLIPSVGGRRRLRSQIAGPPRPAEPTPPWFGGGWSTLNRMLYPADWRCLPARRAAVERLLRRADERGIPVCWLMPPFDPEISERRLVLGADEAYSKLARELMSRFPTLRVVDGRRLRYPPPMWRDPMHLSSLGADAFTAEVAAVLARPPGDRWVELRAGGLIGDDKSAIHDKSPSPGRVAALAAGP